MTTTALDPSIVSAPAVTLLQSDSQSSISSPIACSDWFGHAITSIESGISLTANTVKSAVQNIFWGASDLCADSFVVATIARKLDHHVLAFCEHLSGAPGSLRKCAEMLNHCVAFVDFVQIASDIHFFFFSKGASKANGLTFTGRVAFLAANVGGALLWMQDMSFFVLKNTAAKLGEVRVFSFIPKAISSIPVVREFKALQTVAKAMGELRVFSLLNKLSLLSLVLRALDIGYACFAIDAGIRLWNSENQMKSVSAALDLSHYLSELFLSTMLVAGVTNVVTLGVAGTACIAFAASSYLYRAEYKNELKHDPELPEKAVAE